SNTCKFLRICIAGSLWPIFLDELSSGHYDYYVSFIRRSRRGKYTYLAEVESVRVGKKVVQRFIRYIGREEDGKTVLACSVSEASVEEVKLAGPLMMLHALAEAIGLPDLLGEYAHETLALVYAHCLDYKSLNRMLHWFERTDLNVILNLQDLTERRLVEIGRASCRERVEGMEVGVW